MKKIMVTIMALAMALAAGCMNLYTRVPFTDKKIEKTYQSSGEVLGLSIIVSFPQIMSDSPSTPDFMVENIFTIPCGMVVAADGCVEFVLDTVFWPCDKIIAVNRKKDKRQ